MTVLDPRNDITPSEPAVPIVEARKVFVTFAGTRDILGRPVEKVRAVDGADLTVAAGETIGVLGESGSGKSTFGRVLTGLQKPDSGEIRVLGEDVTQLRGKQMRQMRARMQAIFQDPYSALDPTKTIGHAVGEPLLVHGRCRRSEWHNLARDLMERVALDPSIISRYPRQLSGGQRQRACIARALALEPALLVADEPTSALDLSTRSEILNLLLHLQEESQQAMVLISHDVTTIRHLAHRVAVMYLGRIVEAGSIAEVFENPQHPYTEALLSAVPEPDPELQRDRTRIVLASDPPNPADIPSGCRFRTRCPIVMDECAKTDPQLTSVDLEHSVACLRRAPAAS